MNVNSLVLYFMYTSILSIFLIKILNYSLITFSEDIYVVRSCIRAQHQVFVYIQKLPSL